MAEHRTEEGKRKRKERDRLYYHSVLKVNPTYKNRRKEHYNKNKTEILKRLQQSRLQRNFGLTWEEYQNMYESQDGVCAICKKTNIDRMLAVDHCHKTGKIRGLLCSRCNLGIGQFDDDVELFNRALEYLDGGS